MTQLERLNYPIVSTRTTFKGQIGNIRRVLIPTKPLINSWIEFVIRQGDRTRSRHSYSHENGNLPKTRYVTNFGNDRDPMKVFSCIRAHYLHTNDRENKLVFLYQCPLWIDDFVFRYASSVTFLSL